MSIVVNMEHSQVSCKTSLVSKCDFVVDYFPSDSDSFSCIFFIFAGNCERQREELQLKQKTYSLWGYLAVSFSTEDQFVNPLYDKENKEITNQILRPKIVPQNIKFWRELYCRFERGSHPREPLLDLLAITQNHTTSLEGELLYLLYPIRSKSRDIQLAVCNFNFVFVDHGRQLTKTINYYTQKINVAKSASGVLKSMGMNSPNNVSAADSSPNYNEKRNSLADSNISNVSIGSASSMNNTGNQISPSISIGEEALKTSPGVQADNRNFSKNNSSTKDQFKDTAKEKDKTSANVSTNNTFCDPLLRRESESDNSEQAIPKIKDITISKVVEKCHSST